MEPVKITSFTDVHGIGIVCKDIEKKIENYVKYLGVDPAKVRLFDTQKMWAGMTKEQLDAVPGVLYKGKRILPDIKFCLFPCGDSIVELIEPLTESGNAYADWMAEHGEGIHHMNIKVEDYDKWSDLWDGLGVPRLNDSRSAEGRYRYYDLREYLGMIVEITEKF